jgi:hypothetical protein
VLHRESLAQATHLQCSARGALPLALAAKRGPTTLLKRDTIFY